MANIVFNVALGRGIELYRRVKSADPSTCALLLVPLETSGLETDAVLREKRTLSSLLAGATNEQTTMGRKVLVAADLAAFPNPDDTADSMSVALPTVTWTAATGNAVSKIVVCYRNATADADSVIVPISMFDGVATPDGTDLQLTTGTFLSATSAA